jgi:hypothetical protein
MERLEDSVGAAGRAHHKRKRLLNRRGRRIKVSEGIKIG